MKILIAIPYFYPSVGGMEKHVFELSKRLIKDYKYSIVVVTANHQENRTVTEVIEGIKIYRLSYWFKISNTPINPFWIYRIKKIIKIEKPDIINGRAPVPFIADIAAIASNGIPYVLGYHFPTMKDGSFLKSIIAEIYEKVFLPLLAHKSKSIICSSEFVKDTLFSNYKNKTVVINQGIDFNLFRPGKNINNYTIMFLGNFTSEIKGLRYLIKAIPFVKEKYPNIKLKIISKGNENYYRKIIKRLKIENNVFFLGEIRGKKLVSEYQTSSIFVLPSISDNLPSVVLEAMACKLPVIATNVGALPSIVKNRKTGLLVQPRNITQLSKSIIYLLSNSNFAKKVSQNAYNNIKFKFNWDIQTSLTNKVFLSLKSK